MTSLTFQSPRIEARWRLPLASLLALLALILVRYRDTFAGMVEIWDRSPTFTHAFVVPPLVLWLIWRKRGELAQLPVRPEPWLVLLMAGLALLWWLSQLVRVNAVAHVAVTAMLVLAVPVVLGWSLTRALTFPLAFLFFAVPIGEFMTPYLMHWTAEVLVAGLRLTGIPVYQEGQQLVIPSGRWAVVEACGGIRYFMASFMVGSLFAYLNYQSSRKRWLFVGVSIVMPIVANWLRAYIIVMLGHLSNNEIATGVDHLVYGWVFFGMVIMAMFFIGARWADPPLDPPVDSSTMARSGDGITVVRIAIAVGLAVLALQWPWWVASKANPRELAISSGQPNWLQWPAQAGSWLSTDVPPSDWTPIFEDAPLKHSQGWRGPQGVVGMLVHYYRHQNLNSQLISSTHGLILTMDSRWNTLKRATIETPRPGDTPVQWRNTTLLGSEGNIAPSGERARLTIWQVYWVGDRFTINEFEGKAVQVWHALTGQPDDGAVVHLYSTLTDDAAAERQLSAFVAENFGMLQHTLRQARERR